MIVYEGDRLGKNGMDGTHDGSLRSEEFGRLVGEWVKRRRQVDSYRWVEVVTERGEEERCRLAKSQLLSDETKEKWKRRANIESRRKPKPNSSLVPLDIQAATRPSSIR